MSLVGDPIEGYLRVVRVQIDALGMTLEEALQVVPQEFRAEVRRRCQEEQDQPIQRTRVITRTGGPRSWFAQWRPEQGYHWNRQRTYLLDRLGRNQLDVASIDDQSNKVLSHLEDPRPSGPSQFRVRGLVMGYIQSGKTANISAVIAKAADVGYKLVIVLSGVDDGLRKQTQDRLALELGLVNDPRGVGLPPPGSQWVPVTTGELRGGDFRPGNTDPAVLQGNDRLIAVVKKNAYVLDRLVEWVQRGASPTLPVLVIDDEADQASINTGGNKSVAVPDGGGVPDGDDPSRINGLIRDLVNGFQRVSYVAYTATPFANIFIDPEAFDREVLEDLYPRDFIIALPKPTFYIGAERLFGRPALESEETDLPGLDVIRVIPPADVAAVVPAPGGASGFAPAMCVSLQQALLDFVLASAGRMDRLGDGICSMLIHTSHLTAIHNSLAGLVVEELTRLRQTWLYDSDSVRPTLMARWDGDFRVVTASMATSLERTFEQIEPQIDLFFRSMPEVRVLNVTTSDVLDYQANPQLKVVVIGGNRLSRGLTLENLLVSYYVRSAANYDTLLQMGRWFGYRQRYVDLTRLWTTGPLASRFRHLALVEEELRDEIAVYERARITPMEFGPKIRTHPAMAITAANKMGSARTVRICFAGQLRQTVRFRLFDVPWLQANLDATRKFCGELGRPQVDEQGRPGWVGVPWRQIVQFLKEYQSAEDASSFDSGALASYVRTQAEFCEELTSWRVSLRSRSTQIRSLGVEDCGISEFGPVNLIARSQLKSDRNSIGVLTSPARPSGKRHVGDEEVGLTDEQIDRARKGLEEGTFAKLGPALRAERPRTEGLLLVYPISKFSKAGENDKDRVDLFEDPESGFNVIGLALSFPPSDSAAAVEYSAGAAGRSAGFDGDDDDWN